ncbi:hypothetical protein SARC_02423 [Sphaeroforma arctica JP610]|uniref:Uncharacterized protein n=1 Tax=Sphaeroforma arctica JP610 TaxID=667725 RepID=A0A0L0G903_9EUKA|nr:hypothetical protein SARC_02423 [Sphaeroforma arctica JP610]KNC85389.1 hypothetical protein SARC_02423 [Sphaeroforma arctica JP610]|eukprot:XP_014159291.1 hypothetical protein SARC_02423 [Sphaeroforma arctica JP610]
MLNQVRPNSGAARLRKKPSHESTTGDDHLYNSSCYVNIDVHDDITRQHGQSDDANGAVVNHSVCDTLSWSSESFDSDSPLYAHAHAYAYAHTHAHAHAHAHEHEHASAHTRTPSPLRIRGRTHAESAHSAMSEPVLSRSVCLSEYTQVPGMNTDSVNSAVSEPT